MKKTILGIALLGYIETAAAQNNSIPIRTGVEMEYSIYPGSDAVQFLFTFDSVSTSFIGISYQSISGRSGRYIMRQQSLESSTTGFWGPPHFQQEITLDPHETLLFFPRQRWKELQEKKQVEFDGNVFVQKSNTGENEFLLGDTKVDAIYLESEKTKTRLWLLNNNSFPLILQIENNPHGADARLERIR